MSKSGQKGLKDSPMTPVFSNVELILFPRVNELFLRAFPATGSPRNSLFFRISGVSCNGNGWDISRILPLW